MTLKVVSAAVALYLLLLARSAWKQGELKPFLRALGAVLIFLAALTGLVAGFIWIDGHF